MTKAACLAVACWMGLAACGASGSAPPDVADDVVVASGDAADDVTPPPPVDSGLPPPFSGPNRITLAATWHLAPREERYQCFVTHWQRPGGVRIRRVVTHDGTAMHHVGVFTDLMGAEHEATRECREMGVWGFIYGGGVGTGGITLPDGVALPVADEMPLIVQVHYLNASDQPVDSTTTVDLELAADGESTQPAGSWIVGAPSFRLPARTTMDVTAACTTHPAIAHGFAVFPHMHRLGTRLTLTAGAGGSQVLTDLSGWNFAEQRMVMLTPEQQVGQNVPMQIRCTYNNTTTSDVQMGLSTTDEMCIAVTYYWPATVDQGLGFCYR
jgi:hypothetical protein